MTNSAIVSPAGSTHRARPAICPNRDQKTEGSPQLKVNSLDRKIDESKALCARPDSLLDGCGNLSAAIRLNWRSGYGLGGFLEIVLAKSGHRQKAPETTGRARLLRKWQLPNRRPITRRSLPRTARTAGGISRLAPHLASGLRGTRD